MSTSEIIELISLGITAAGLIFSIVAAIVRGNMKDFIIKCMEDAERTGMSGKTKYEYVILQVKEKYKIAALLLNVRKFIEKVISVSKKINAKGGK